MRKADKYVVVFAAIGLVYFAIVIGVSLWQSFPGGGQ